MVSHDTIHPSKHDRSKLHDLPLKLHASIARIHSVILLVCLTLVAVYSSTAVALVAVVVQ